MKVIPYIEDKKAPELMEILEELKKFVKAKTMTPSKANYFKCWLLLRNS